MRVALMGDLHANLPALEALLEHSRHEGAEAIWNLGDLVGYGAFPEDVVKRLRASYALSTLGAYDRQVVRFEKRKEKRPKKKGYEEYQVLEWTWGQLSGKSRKYLRFLSQEIRMQVRGKRVLLSHGGPGDEGGLHTSAPEKQLAKVARDAKADLILCGCSHEPFARVVDGVWFVNPGSAGLPTDGDPRVSYAILDLAPDASQVYHHRVEYDVERLIAELDKHKLPGALSRAFREGRTLEAILDSPSG